MPVKSTSKSSRNKINKQNKKMPMRISRFCIWTIALPLVAAVLLTMLAYSDIPGRGATGPYAGLAGAAIALFLIYAACGVIFIIGLLGVIYAFIKARHDWRYYALSLILPILLLGGLVFSMVQQKVHYSSPEFDRYLSNVNKCSDIIVEGRSSKYGLPSELYKGINNEQLNLQDYDDRVKALYDPGADIWNSGVCDDDQMTEAELAELKIYYSEHRELQKDLLLLEILELEARGDGYVCDFVRSYSKVEEFLPPAATSEGAVCVVHWLSWEHGGDYISTLDLLLSDE